MKRRTLLGFIALGPFFAHVHAQPKTMKGIKEMQDNWKSLLAPGTPTPSPSTPTPSGPTPTAGALATGTASATMSG